MSNTAKIQAEVERNYKYNFTVNTIDGVTFWFGLSFFAYRTILPVYIASLTTSEFAIGVLSTIVAAGWLLPQLFTSNWVESLPIKKNIPVKIGFWTERLPIFLLVPAALLATLSKSLAMILSLTLVAWHVLGAGVIAVGWQDMIAKIFPVDRRGKFFGVANFGGTAAGIAGASFVAWLLDRFAFPYSYAVAFTVGSVFILISWFFLAMTREPEVPPQGAPVSNREYWRKLPAIVKRDKNFRRYLLTQILLNAGGMPIGFLAVYAVQRWDLPDSQAGLFTVAMLVGQALSNLFFGWLADKKGHKIVLEICVLTTGLTAGLAAFAPSSYWFYLVFFLTGMSTAGFILSGTMIVFEFSTPEIRPTYIGINNTFTGIVAAAMPMIGGWLASVYNYQTMFMITAIIILFGLVLLRWWVREPRTNTNLAVIQE